MAEVSYVFKRMEKKYLLTREQFIILEDFMKPYMQKDKYGLHTICNIYYDTEQYDLIRNSISKPKYKEKFRVRSYGIPNKKDKVFLEIKKKYDGVVYKRRVSLTLEESERYLAHGIKPREESQIFREIDYFMKFYNPKPKLYLAYDRIAYFGKEDESIRITVDHNIRSRHYDLDLSKGDYGEFLLQSNKYLMEVKVPGAMPVWLASILSKVNIYPTSFSKYGSVYKRDVINNRREGLCLQAF